VDPAEGLPDGEAADPDDVCYLKKTITDTQSPHVETPGRHDRLLDPGVASAVLFRRGRWKLKTV